MRNKQGQIEEQPRVAVNILRSNTATGFSFLSLVDSFKAIVKGYLFTKNFRVDWILGLWLVEIFKTSSHCFSLLKWALQKWVNNI